MFLEIVFLFKRPHFLKKNQKKAGKKDSASRFKVHLPRSPVIMSRLCSKKKSMANKQNSSEHFKTIRLISSEEEFKSLIWGEPETQATTPNCLESPSLEEKTKTSANRLPPKNQIEKRFANLKETGRKNTEIKRQRSRGRIEEETKKGPTKGEKDQCLLKGNQTQETRQEILVPKSSYDEGYYARVKKIRERFHKNQKAINGVSKDSDSKALAPRSIKDHPSIQNSQGTAKTRIVEPYIFTGSSLNVPSNSGYELTSEDLKFLKKFERSAVKVREYEHAVVIWENASEGKTNPISLDQAMAEIKKNKLETMVACPNVAKEMFCYWKNIREKVKRSLVRKFWKNNYQKEAKNPNFAFRPRREQKMKLRKNKANEQENLEKV